MTEIGTKERQRRPSAPSLGVNPPVSSFAPIEYRNFVRNIIGVLGLPGLIIGLPALIKSGIRPGTDDPKSWYDRAIRVIGGTLILLVFGGAMVEIVVEKILAP